jgi:hypothetical protein
MDLLQEIKAILNGVTTDDFIPKEDITQKALDNMQIAIWEISAMVNREIDKKDKQFLMS